MKTKERLCTKIALSIFFLLVLCRTAGAQDSQKATLTAADAGTCSATSTACLVINIPSGSGGATFNIGVNASANTVQFEASADYGATWVALSVTPSSSTTAVTSTTSTGAWQANVAGYTKARMRCSTFVGGTTTTYINLSTASARSNGGGGSVTHTAGNLTAFHLMLGNGLADSTVDSACLTNGTGALSGCTSLSAGSGASAAGATATGGFACVEGASTGWTPTAGQDYQRCDSTLHTFVCSINGAAEGTCPSNAVVNNPSATQTITATGVNTIPLAISCAASTLNYCLTVKDSGGNVIMGVDPEAAGAVSFYEAGGSAGRVNIGNTGTNNFIVVDPNVNLTTTLGGLKALNYQSSTNCSSSASPAVCGSAAAGSVAVPTGVTPTLVVNTTAVTANSQILFTPDESLGTKLSVTCNSTIAQVAIEPIVTARTAATSFTIQYNTTITVNPICLNYLIIN